MLRKNTLLIANVYSNNVTLLDEDNHEDKVELPVGVNPHEVVVSPDGLFALVANYGDLSGKHPGNTLTSINVIEKKVIETIQLPDGSRPHGIAFISDRVALVTAQGIAALLVVQCDEQFENGTVVNSIAMPSSGAHMVTLTADKRYAYVGCFSGDVCKVDVSDYLSPTIKVEKLTVGDDVSGVALSQDGKLLFAANMSMRNSFVAVIDTEEMSLTKVIKTRVGPSRVSLYNEGKSALIIDSIAGKAEILDIETLTITNHFNTTNSKSQHKGRFCGGLFGAVPVPVNAVIKQDQTAYMTHLYAGNVTKLNLQNGEILETFEADVSPDGIDYSSVVMARR